jgi:hypothetical protein
MEFRDVGVKMLARTRTSLGLRLAVCVMARNLARGFLSGSGGRMRLGWIYGLLNTCREGQLLTKSHVTLPVEGEISAKVP